MTFNLFYTQNSNNHPSKAFGECIISISTRLSCVLFAMCTKMNSAPSLNALFFCSSKFIQNVSLCTFKSQVNNYEV